METTEGSGGLTKPLVAVVAPFVVAGVVVAAMFDENYTADLALWQAIILWPIGAILLVGPVAIAAGIRHRGLYVGAMAAIAIVGAISMAAVASSDDGQAGFGWLYAPLVGIPAAVAAVALDRWLPRADP